MILFINMVSLPQNVPLCPELIRGQVSSTKLALVDDDKNAGCEAVGQLFLAS